MHRSQTCAHCGEFFYEATTNNVFQICTKCGEQYCPRCGTDGKHKECDKETDE